MRRSSSAKKEYILPMTTTENTKTSRKSARKVLSAAGRPLRSVGRRLTSRFQGPPRYGSIEPDDSRTTSSLVEHAVSSLRSLNSGSAPGSPEIRRRHVARTEQSNVVVRRFEYVLRQVLLLAIAFLLGVKYPQGSAIVQKIVEYSLVAWITCLGIWITALWQQKSTMHEEETPLLMETREPSDLTREIIDWEAASAESKAERSVVHHALEPYFVIDTPSNKRIFPNTSSLYQISNDYFEGTMMILIKTPDMDNPSAPQGTHENAGAKAYLMDKQRRFEFQFQVRLKKVPSGRVYFACELDEPVKLGMVQRAFVSAAMAFVKSTNQNFHYSITGQAESEDGKYEKPHMAFPVEEGMNRVVTTPPEETPPTLGAAIDEDEASLKKRKKGGRIEWNMQDTYTFSLWSAYVDFLEWKCVNLPGIRPFELANVIGPQHINLTLYEIPESKVNEKHYRRDITNIVHIEMSNANESGVGPAAQLWLSKHQVADMPAAEEEDVADYQARIESEELAIAELGEGIYVHSGDSISLRESSLEDDAEANGSPCFVANGGGFAVLQEKSSSTIVIEKPGKARSKSASSKLIKSGDTVIFKLISKGRKGEEPETRYLSIHRGWWLKWVSKPPSKNGSFTIHTHETEYSDHDGDPQSTETQSSYLTLGGSFWLRHKRWSKFLVGVAVEGSATYGGRMLGLYIPPKDGTCASVEESAYVSDEELQADLDQPEEAGGKTGKWMRPLQLQAYESVTSIASDESLKEEGIAEEHELIFDSEHYRMDVPAWLEIMNRTERIRQLTYAVRVLPSSMEEGESGSAFVRLRTGNDLAQIMRVGLNWRNSSASPPWKKLSTDREPTSPQSVGTPPGPPTFPSRPSPLRKRSVSSPIMAELSDKKRAHSFDDLEGLEYPSKVDVGLDLLSSDSEDWDVESGDEVDIVEIDEDGNETPVETRLSKPRKGRKLIGKFARSVKSKTKSTGKNVVRKSVQAGKGTLSAGKALVPRRPKNPPSKEPKSKAPARQSRKRREKDLRVVSSRSMKRIEREESNCSFLESPTVLAGELSAPEQSCRTVSKMLSRMSSLPPSTSRSTAFSALLAAQVEAETEQDALFLHGGAMQLGVVPVRSDILEECVVARCLWESHWREEWCGLYKDGIVFYAPLTRSPCLELSFDDIQCIRLLAPGARSPLVGYPVLVLETAWLCHYVAFANDEMRETFREKADRVRALARESDDPVKAVLQKELWQARFWQGFQSSAESSLSSGNGKWAEVLSGTKLKSRVILNNRRAVFDLEPQTIDESEFVEHLLSTSLSFSLDSLNEHPEALVNFLDATSHLRTMSLQEMDFDSAMTFCTFVNLYHCLFQHALLMSVRGQLHKRSCGHFMRTMCYEIGGDVFSLAELQCCVIRGNMSHPISPKPPYVDVPKKSNAYRFYALGYTSPRVNFVLNTGDVACPREVPVLRVELLEAQLNVCTALFIRNNVTVDMTRRLILLPKLCEVYRDDFAVDSAGAPRACLQYCLSFLDEYKVAEILALLQDEQSSSVVAIKYQPSADQYHTVLRLRTFEAESEPSNSNV